MNPVTAIVADDEENLRVSVVKQLKAIWPELEIIGEARNGLEAEDMIERLVPDIAFLDIRMPGKTGLEVAKQKVSDCRIVFITAYDQYAVQAFESEAVDYILKPVTPKRLETSVNRLKKQIENITDAGPDNRIQKVIQVLENRQQPEYLRLVKVKTGSDIRFVPVAEIFFFKAEDKYTIVQTAHHEHLIKTPIKDLETRLDPKLFWRVHRSSIINVEKIKVIKRSFTNQMQVGFEQIDQTIAVSRSYEHLFKSM